ncbi:protease complex subunit PrcB family protein [Tumebacillus sp. ITR2]|uniref:Protease complex subunit PrcB family protein n=1 Tax=Tumebacillus amylolyticus TaxID=2801339 RepID=A0ABS1JE42_9BACL|nr:protease complex subunit PrcB family protein [Tumebacillus amylolyticus]MBL0388556.1 protease complex subunit PrcB family protein [Tumebacillus amylolyticus]
MMKKTFTALMVTALTLTSASAVFAADDNGGKIIAPHLGGGEVSKLHTTAPKYNDTNGHFSADSVERLSNYHMISGGKIGGPAASFDPNSKADRVELRTWIKNALGKEIADSNSTGDVSRVEVATWIATSLPAMNTGINGANLTAPYTDIKGVSASERDALNTLYKLGIMVGDGAGHFNPQAILTRGEAAVLLDQAVTRSMTVATKVDFEAVSDNLPQTVQTVANENRTEPGVYSVVDNDVRYLVVTGGQAPTGGYSVNIDGISETAAGLFVDASLVHPDPTMMVPQMVTYPTVVLKVKNSEKNAYLAQ